MLNNALLRLIGKGEIILVDSFSHSPAMFSVLNKGDETIFVTNDDFPSILKSREFINRLEKEGMGVIGLVVNRRRKETQKEHIESIVGKKVIAELPHDDKVIDSINMKQPVLLMHPKTEVSRQIAELAKLLDV